MTGRRGCVCDAPVANLPGAQPCTPRSPVSKARWVLHGPLRQVERSVPRDQARGAVGNNGRALGERDRVPGGLGRNRERELIQQPGQAWIT